MTRAGRDNKNKKESRGRGERLAAALRENLHRRKARERERALPATNTAKNGPPVPADDEDH